MRILTTLAIALMALVAAHADTKKTTELFTLDHQMSEMCEKKIVTNLRFEKGVQDIKVSLKENTISISYDPQKTNTTALIAAFKKIGFNAMPAKTPQTTATKAAATKVEKAAVKAKATGKAEKAAAKVEKTAVKAPQATAVKTQQVQAEPKQMQTVKAAQVQTTTKQVQAETKKSVEK